MNRTVPGSLMFPLIAALGMAATGCGSSSGSSSASPGSGSATPLAIQGAEYSFTGPTSVAAGLVSIQFSNAGKEEHEAQLLKIDAGHSGDELIKLASQPESAPPLWVHGAGGNAVVAPGASSSITQVLSPGTYYFLCFVSGADNQPHVAKGMHTTLTVTGSDTGASLPSSTATVAGKEYDFDVPSLKAGSNTLTVRNDGPNQLHEFALIKLAPGFTVDKLKAGIASNGPPPPGPPPFTSLGGVAAFDPGGTATFTADLESGTSYAFICFVPDHQGGPPHAAKGMIHAATVGS